MVDFLRVRVDSGSVETVAHLTAVDPVESDKASFRGYAWVTTATWMMFYAFDVEGQLSAIVWFRSKNQETVDRFNPVDFAVRVDSPVLA